MRTTIFAMFLLYTFHLSSCVGYHEIDRSGVYIINDYKRLENYNDTTKLSFKAAFDKSIYHFGDTIRIRIVYENRGPDTQRIILKCPTRVRNQSLPEWVGGWGESDVQSFLINDTTDYRVTTNLAPGSRFSWEYSATNYGKVFSSGQDYKVRIACVNRVYKVNDVYFTTGIFTSNLLTLKFSTE